MAAAEAAARHLIGDPLDIAWKLGRSRRWWSLSRPLSKRSTELWQY
jgi:hypothetical protein